MVSEGQVDSSYSHVEAVYDGWILYYSPEGFPYYHNEETGESRWAGEPDTHYEDEYNPIASSRNAPGEPLHGSEDGDSQFDVFTAHNSPKPNALSRNSPHRSNRWSVDSRDSHGVSYLGHSSSNFNTPLGGLESHHGKWSIDNELVIPLDSESSRIDSAIYNNNISDDFVR